MAYKRKEDEKSYLLFDFPRRGTNFVRLSAIVSGGVTQYDIRNMYLNEAGDECFTSKGVRVSAAEMADIVKLVAKHEASAESDSNKEDN